jgi:large subunit ribosomal protein L23
MSAAETPTTATKAAKPAKAAAPAKTPKTAAAKKAAKAAAAKAAPAPVAKAAIQPSERLINLLLAPHVSEKAARAGEKHNQFVFRVRLDATKPEIAKAVELMFSVDVEAVQVVNVGGKKKRFGASFGRRSDWKKAYVSLKAGQTIDLSGTAKA